MSPDHANMTPFLNLPCEIRLIVYGYLFGIIYIDPARQMTTPAVLLVNRQVSSEAKELLYDRSTFVIHRIPKSTLKRIIFSNYALCRIRHLSIKHEAKIASGPPDGGWQLLQFLYTLVSFWHLNGYALKTIEIDFSSNEIERHLTCCVKEQSNCVFIRYINHILE